jgi:hypothetical protein
MIGSARQRDPGVRIYFVSLLSRPSFSVCLSILSLLTATLPECRENEHSIITRNLWKRSVTSTKISIRRGRPSRIIGDNKFQV